MIRLTLSIGQLKMTFRYLKNSFLFCTLWRTLFDIEFIWRYWNLRIEVYLSIHVDFLHLLLICCIMSWSNIWWISSLTYLSYHNSHTILIIFCVIWSLFCCCWVQLSIRFLALVGFFLLWWNTLCGHRHFWRLEINPVHNLITFSIHSAIYLRVLLIWLIPSLVDSFFSKIWSTISLVRLWMKWQSAIWITVTITFNRACLITISHIKRYQSTIILPL